MLYLNEEHLLEIGIHWSELVDHIETTVQIIDAGDYAQPLKPYLRYRNPRNRIIAMPAYVGGAIGTAGLKWIASFPDNAAAGLPRAHSVTVLNDADTGLPYAIVNTALASAARTAAVSGLMLRHYLLRTDDGRNSIYNGDNNESVRENAAEPRRLAIGIIGWGPIGQLHGEMCLKLFGERIDLVAVYDTCDDARQRETAYGRRSRSGETPDNLSGLDKIQFVDSWQELYAACNIVITCTVSDRRYIHLPPEGGKLLLDVSLRDYEQTAIEAIQSIVVDDWAEVCRENTDIELLHRECGLKEANVRTLADVVCRGALYRYEPDEPVLFCPMGMASFDVAIAEWFARKGEELGIGLQLP